MMKRSQAMEQVSITLQRSDVEQQAPMFRQEDSHRFHHYFQMMGQCVQEVVLIRTLSPIIEVNYISPNYEQIWGKPCQTLYDDPQSWLQSVHASDRPLVQRNLEQLDQTEGVDCTFRILLPSGIVRWIHSQSTYLSHPLAVHHAPQSITVFRDVTMVHCLRESNQQLIDQQQLLHRLLDRMYHATSSSHMDWQQIAHLLQAGFRCQQVDMILKTNHGHWRWLFRHSKESQSILEPADHVYHAVLTYLHTHGHLCCRWDQLGSPACCFDGQPIENLMYVVQKPNKRIWGAFALIGMTSLFQPGMLRQTLQQVGQLLATWMHHQQLQGAYKRSQKWFHAVTTHTPHVVVMGQNRADGPISFVNHSFEKIFQVPTLKLRQNTQIWLERVHHEDKPRVVQALGQMEKCDHFDEIYRIVRPDGSIRWIHGQMFLLPEREQVGVKETLSFAMDVTEHHILRIQQSKLDKLQLAIKARDNMLAHVAHDLGAPLNSILFTTHTLQRHHGHGVVQHSLARIVRSAERMGHLLRDLLLVAQFESGSFSIQKGMHDVSRLLHQAVADFSVQAQCYGIQFLVTHVEPSCVMAIDPYRFLQILDNSFKNAIEHTRAGTQVYISLRALAHTIELMIRDTGPGMDPQTVGQLFVPFWQREAFHNHNPQGRRGSGLGLSIVRHLVQSHGGEVNIRSQLGLGTELLIVLPKHHASLVGLSDVGSPIDRKLSMAQWVKTH